MWNHNSIQSRQISVTTKSNPLAAASSDSIQNFVVRPCVIVSSPFSRLLGLSKSERVAAQDSLAAVLKDRHRALAGSLPRVVDDQQRETLTRCRHVLDGCAAAKVRN